MIYLLNLTFYAGDDLPENTDRGIYCLESNAELTAEKIYDIDQKVNDKLNDYDDENSLSVSYFDDGTNIDTLNKGVEEDSSVKITELTNNSGPLNISNYFEFEIWQ